MELSSSAGDTRGTTTRGGEGRRRPRDTRRTMWNPEFPPPEEGCRWESNTETDGILGSGSFLSDSE